MGLHIAIRKGHIMTKELLKAAEIRAFRSFLQALVMSIPAGFVVTPAMIQYFNIDYVYAILAIVLNCALYALGSFITCIVGGLPEVELQETLYSLDNVVYEDEEEDDADY